MTDRLARIVGSPANEPGRPPEDMNAYCRHCEAILATRGATVRLGDGLVSRPSKKDGLPRFGPPRRLGHRDARAASGSFPKTAAFARAEIGNPAAFYVNCPQCDRGQVVRWPGGRLPRG